MSDDGECSEKAMTTKDSKKKMDVEMTMNEMGTTLKTLVDSIVGIQKQVNGVNESIGVLENKLDKRISNMSATVVDTVKEHFEPQIQGIKDNVRDIESRMHGYSGEYTNG